LSGQRFPNTLRDGMGVAALAGLIGLLLGLLTLVAPPAPARAADYSAPEWLPVRSAAKVGCVRFTAGGPCGGSYHGYWALDLLGSSGVPIHAAGSGIAHVGGRDNTCNPNYPYLSPGNWIWIDHGGGVTSRYLHLSSIDITDGQQVSPSTMIGRMGSTGCHLPAIWDHRVATGMGPL
jgi:murein DD-endopeptidase MepM/ murein hydrolase activator NlpD